MWHNTYKDYKPDSDWIQKKVESGKGIVGCEMHELNGWGHRLHTPIAKKKTGWLRTFAKLLFKKQ